MVAAIFVSCNSKNKTETITVDQIEGNEIEDIVTITNSQFEASGMLLGKLTEQEFNTEIKVNGMFTVPPQNKASVSTYFEGYVKNITLLPGSSVKKGQVLFTLENPDYIQIQQKFLEAKGQLEYLKLDYERQKALLEDNVTSKKNFLKAESDYKVTLAQYQALKKQLSLMNINANTLTTENIQSTIVILSPLTGVVTSVSTSKGMFLNPSDVALTITNTENLQIALKIFEKDLPLVKEGQLINIKVLNSNQQVYKAKIILVNKSIDEQQRTIDVYATLINTTDKKLFAPGMFVEAEILTNTHTYWALPKEAVISIEDDYFVLIKESNNTYKRQQVQVGVSNNEYIQILNKTDFSTNTEFLVKGVFNLIGE